jgi:hypothetical protein
MNSPNAKKQQICTKLSFLCLQRIEDTDCQSSCSSAVLVECISLSSNKHFQNEYKSISSYNRPARQNQDAISKAAQYAKKAPVASLCGMETVNAV